MIPTMLELLRDRAQQFAESGSKLLIEYSAVHSIDRIGDTILVISACGDHGWDPLSLPGKHLQAQLIAETNRFWQLIRTLTHELPAKARENLDSAMVAIRSTIEQDSLTWVKSTDEAVTQFRAAIELIVTTLNEYFGERSGEILAVVDTNALLYSSALESWHYDDIQCFTIILTPSVLAELDKLKVSYRNPDIRGKAEAIIQRIKEYRRRGILTNGVPVLTNKVYIRSIATEPVMSVSLPWLDPSIADDRFLASTIDIIRTNPAAAVFVITRDINLQNKADFAGIPYREPPQKNQSAQADSIGTAEESP